MAFLQAPRLKHSCGNRNSCRWRCGKMGGGGLKKKPDLDIKRGFYSSFPTLPSDLGETTLSRGLSGKKHF